MVLGQKWCIAARESLCFAKPARDTDFWTGKGVSRQGETAQRAKTCSRYRYFCRKGCIAARVNLYFHKTCSRYRLLDGKWCVAARKTVQCTKTRSRHRFFSRKGCVAAWRNSSTRENPFATGQWGRIRVGGQLRFYGCDFLLSLRPFFEKLRSVV